MEREGSPPADVSINHGTISGAPSGIGNSYVKN
jgi:hypothetical protein